MILSPAFSTRTDQRTSDHGSLNWKKDACKMNSSFPELLPRETLQPHQLAVFWDLVSGNCQKTFFSFLKNKNILAWAVSPSVKLIMLMPFNYKMGKRLFCLYTWTTIVSPDWNSRGLKSSMKREWWHCGKVSSRPEVFLIDDSVGNAAALQGPRVHYIVDRIPSLYTITRHKTKNLQEVTEFLAQGRRHF